MHSTVLYFSRENGEKLVTELQSAKQEQEDLQQEFELVSLTTLIDVDSISRLYRGICSFLALTHHTEIMHFGPFVFRFNVCMP